MKTAVLPHIRWMNRPDLFRVLEIEAASFEAPWQEEDFLRCLRQRNCIGMVAERGEEIMGHMVYELHKHSLGVLNLAVCPSWRRQGVGAAMLAKLVSKLAPNRRGRVDLDVGEDNLAAQLWLRASGFRCGGVSRGAFGGGLDSYHFSFHVEGAWPE